jgi:hypothetical protein
MDGQFRPEQWVVIDAHEDEGGCSISLGKCRGSRAFESRFTPEQWAAIDAHIVAHSLLLAIKAIRELAGVGVADANHLLYERYCYLRAEQPERFTCSDEEYWDGVYS